MILKSSNTPGSRGWLNDVREENSSLPARNAALGIHLYSFKILLVAFLLQPQGTAHDAAQPSHCSLMFEFQGEIRWISQVIQYKTLFSSETFLSAAAFSNLLASSPMYDRVY